jgi:uncharacterized protein involved in exopolysaccharide biosynthesis
MAEPFSFASESNAGFNFTLRDIVAVFFRQKRTILMSFAGVAAGVLLVALTIQTKYVATTKLLVKRERMDPVVTPEQTAPVMFSNTITEEEINSEVDLIQSDEVLRKVVLANGLTTKPFLAFLRPAQSPQERTDKAVRALFDELQVEPMKKTNLIEIRYASTKPELAAAVLKSVNQFYMEKHLSVHHPAGQMEFFEQETADYGKHLEEAEQQLKNFSAEQGGVAPQVQRDLTLQKLNEFNASLQQTRTEIASTETKIQNLKSQSGTTPTRLTTQSRRSDNPQVMEQLKSSLNTLELKRIELLTKYQPTYRLVQEVDKQIADTKASIVNEESSPIKEEITDQNPTYAWISSELAKAEADLSALRAQEAATQAAVAMFNSKAHELEQQGLVQQDLLRTEKTNEESYLLYRRKREEARIADALDRNRILNIAVVQEPQPPTLPANSRFLFGLVGVLMAAVLSFVVGFAMDFMDKSFRTPSEVANELNIPVLAAVPVARHVGSSRSDDGYEVSLPEQDHVRQVL